MDFLKDSTWVWRVIILSLIIIWICVPGSTAGLFNGLPLSAYEGLLTLSFIMLTFGIPWQKMTRARWLIIAGFISLIIIQLWGASSLPYGWSVCLKRLVKPETLTTPCEPTAEFKSGERSYIFPAIDWARNQIPLYFMNDKQAFNFYQENEPNRTRLPYTITISASMLGGDNQSVTLKTWNPAATLKIDTTSYTPVKDEPLTIPLPENRLYNISVEANHNRANEDYIQLTSTGHPWYQLTGQHPPSATTVNIFKSLDYSLILFTLVAFVSTALRSLQKQISPSSFWGYVTITTYLLCMGAVTQEIWQLAIILAILLAWLWLAHTPEDRWAAIPALLVLGFHVLRTIGQGSWSAEDTRIYEYIFLPALLWVCWYVLTRNDQEKSHLIPWIILLLLFNSCNFISHTHPPGSLVLFDGGGDELTHEGFARQALLARTFSDYLINGENYVFYYQPLYRYFLAAFHQFWGEAMFGAYVIQTWLMSMAILAGLYCLRLLRLPAATVTMTLLIGMTSLRGELNFFTITQNAWQQGLSMPLLLLAIWVTCAMLIKPQLVRASTVFWVSLVWGVVFSIRTDYLPMAAITLIAFLLLLKPIPNKQRLQYSALMIIGLGIFPSLVIARNYVVAHQLVFMPTSGLYNIIPPLGGVFVGQDLRSIGSLAALGNIIQHYSTNLQGLAPILWDNVTNGFIGKTLAAQILWYLVPAIMLVNSVLLRGRSRLVTILLFLWAFVQVLPAIFFVQHNRNAMIAHYDYLWLALLAIMVGVAIEYHQKNSKWSRK